MKNYAKIVRSALILSACVTVGAAFGQSTSAAVGDIAGTVYHTDIVTKLNGAPIDSINIGGQTMISAEDMMYYSFDVFFYAADAPKLTISSTPRATKGEPPKVVKANAVPGTPSGHYYETNIVTTLDGKPITAYNLGGRTYIHAEQMLDFGYLVSWNPDARTLDITSPDRAGYVYSYQLTMDKAVSEDGVGAFKLAMEDGKLRGAGDTDYFNSSFFRTKDGDYCIHMSFYQNRGLFKSTELQRKLESVASTNVYGDSVSPEEKYASALELIDFRVNGFKAEKLEISIGGGNGHRDYVIVAKGLPRLAEHELSSLEITVGEIDSALGEIVLPESPTADIDEAAAKLMINPDDYLANYYRGEYYTMLHFRESPSLGRFIEHLYLLKNGSDEISADILEQVRALEGFDYEKMYLYGFTTKAYGVIPDGRFGFCVRVDDRSGDFMLDPVTEIAVLLATTIF